ncbi:GNAT family N-acetyltransferase [Tautonia plasticadhaerens]|uniref:Arginyl-tRNA-protein transferase n=1 Tax=Tautonia plasticadhaerens TaxID=2527974 RepID=A0A518GYV1_9BACT|nr:GNAT family N-acetyltransferase [Tautonia plasticadhaerens]QDV33790.1 arginyl-tRNA-protein transferase [Tautonia plasticadhaerens]
MRSSVRFIAPHRPCAYLREQLSRMEYEVVLSMDPEEYLDRLRDGWRRFGRTLFRPRCRACSACLPMRVVVPSFRPDRSMKRLRARNLDAVGLTIRGAAGLPDPEVLDLYDRYHREQARRRGWPEHEPDAPDEFRDSFLDNPIPTEEWRYRLDGRLIGVGYADVLPGASSAIYFFYDHDALDRSPGTWNILCMIERAAAQAREHVYLGYLVEGCRSLSYKGRFSPNEVRGPEGRWIPFRG